MTPFIERILRAARLDAHLYEEVEADTGATVQALVVIVLSHLAAGIALREHSGLAGLASSTFLALVSWVVWAFLTYLIGAKLLPGPNTHANIGELLRTTGFASSPGIVRVFGIVPGLSFAVMSIASVWMLVAMVVAVRHALDYESTWRALGVCLLGWVLQAAILGGLFVHVGEPSHVREI